MGRRKLAPPILLRLALYRWRIRIFDLDPMRRHSSAARSFKVFAGKFSPLLIPCQQGPLPEVTKRQYPGSKKRTPGRNSKKTSCREVVLLPTSSSNFLSSVTLPAVSSKVPLLFQPNLRCVADPCRNSPLRLYCSPKKMKSRYRRFYVL